MTSVVVKPEPEMIVTKRESGYAHEKIWGNCSVGTTVKDVIDKFYDPYFGGRDASVNGTSFYCVVHTD
jgi:hypothetical protein